MRRFEETPRRSARQPNAPSARRCPRPIGVSRPHPGARHLLQTHRAAVEPAFHRRILAAGPRRHGIRRLPRHARGSAEDGVRTRHAMAARQVPRQRVAAGCGCVGCTGNTDVLYPVIGWMTVQLAALHSTRDLSMVLLSPRSKEHGTTDGMDWSFAQWLPHFTPHQGQNAVPHHGGHRRGHGHAHF